VDEVGRVQELHRHVERELLVGVVRIQREEVPLLYRTDGASPAVKGGPHVGEDLLLRGRHVGAEPADERRPRLVGDL
jgi:hypothetical protein